ncbi:MAG: hypothetical protein V1725_06205 [archaeon]
MNCVICGKKVKETFLKKIVGSYVRNASGKNKRPPTRAYHLATGQTLLRQMLCPQPDDAVPKMKLANKPV